MPLGALLNDAKTDLADAQVAVAPFDDMWMGLTTDTDAIAADMDPANILAGEPTFSGYARQQLLTPQPAFLTGDFHARVLFAEVTFGNTSGSDQGPYVAWFFINGAGTLIYFCGEFDFPPTIPDAGSFTTRPFYQRTSEVP